MNDKPDVLHRASKNINKHALDFLYAQELGVGTSPKLFLGKQIWRRVSDEEIILVNSTVDNSSAFDKAYIDANVSVNYVVAKASTLITFKPHEHNDACTDLMYIVQLDLGGLIPHPFIDRGATDFLNDFTLQREQFSEDFEIDKQSRLAILSDISRLELEGRSATESEKVAIWHAKVRRRAKEASEP